MSGYHITTKKTWAETMVEIDDAFYAWGVKAVDWSVAGDSRRWATQSLSPAERKVTLTFKHPSGKIINVSMDAQTRPVDNLRALYLAIDDLRMIERRGLADLVGTVYLQLNAGAPMVAGEMMLSEAYTALELAEGSSWDIVQAVYRTLSKRYHPDAGGNPELFRYVTTAYETIERHEMREKVTA